MKTQSSLTSVTTLPNQKQDNQELIVDILERYLEKARAGELREIVLCSLLDGQSVWGNVTSSGIDFPNVIGMLHLTLHEWESKYLNG